MYNDGYYRYSNITPMQEFTYEGRRMIRRSSNVFALSTVAAAVFANAVLSIIIASVARIDIAAATYFYSAWGGLVVQTAFSVLMFSVAFIVAARIDKTEVRGLLQIRKVRASLLWPLVGCGLGVSLVINDMVSRFVGTLNQIGINPSAGELAIPDGLVGEVVYAIVISLVPAIMEEFAMRGIVLGSLRKYGTAFAIIVSSMLFGLLHGNLVQIPFAFALGCVLAYVDVVADSIIPSVIIHFVNNLLSAVQKIVSKRYGDVFGTYTIIISFAMCAVVGIVSFVFLCKKHSHPFAPIKDNPVFPLGTAVKYSCSSVGMIVAFVVFGGEALVNVLFN